MKKLLMITVALAAAIAAYGAKPTATNEVDAARAKVAAYAAAYDRAALPEIPRGIVKLCATNAALAAEFDAVFAEKPPVSLMAAFPSNTLSRTFPRGLAAAFDAYGSMFPAHVAYYNNGGSHEYGGDKRLNKLNFLMEVIAMKGLTRIDNIKHARVATIAAAKENVRKKLRAEGLPIVGTNAQITAQARLDAVAAAFDAPLFAGLDTALAACGITITMPSFAKVPQGEAIANLQAGIYNGDISFGPILQGMLRIALGLTAYNEFVERYNGTGAVQ